MNKSLRVLMLLIIAAAAVLIMILGSNWMNLGKQLQETNMLLSESRKSWETTASEKEELQDQLQDLKDELKEANLSLTEAEERASTLTAEIEQLQKDIAELTEKDEKSSNIP